MQGKIAVLLAFLGVHLVVSFLFTPVGYVSIDEVTYHFMAENLRSRGSLEVRNGYDEFPSVEFVAVANLAAVGDRVVSQYPAFWSFLAFPFYRVAGVKGLFWLNGLSFIGVIALVALLARHLFKDWNLALNAALILALATYLWEYSQGIWPHVNSVLFVVAAVYVAVRSFSLERKWICHLLSAAAGVLVGLGAGVRLDVILIIPPIMVAGLLAGRRIGWMLCFVVGLLPGAAALVWTNYIKFGTLSPLSYGSAGGNSRPHIYLPVLAAGAACCALILWLHRSSRIARPTWWVGLGVLGLGASLLVPQVSTLVLRQWHGLLELVADLRWRLHSPWESDVPMTSTGVIVYLAGFKKALLQSCPYLGALSIPAARFLERNRDVTFPVLALPVLTYVGIFSAFAWHGGQCLNLRYFLVPLCFTSILMAQAWRDLNPVRRVGRRPLVLAGAATAGVTLLASLSLSSLGPFDEAFYLSLPLLLASALFLLSLVWLVAAGTIRERAGRVLSVLLMVCFVWAAGIAFFHDVPRTVLTRLTGSSWVEQVEDLIEPDSLVFYESIAFARLLEKRGVRLAAPGRPRASDDFADFPILTRSFQTRGIPVYAIFQPATWRRLDEKGLLAGLQTVTLLEHPLFRVARIEAPEDH